MALPTALSLLLTEHPTTATAISSNRPANELMQVGVNPLLAGLLATGSYTQDQLVSLGFPSQAAALFTGGADPLTAGTITPGSVTSTAISATASAATGGTGPYTYQWYGSTSNGFVPGGGNIISGQTSLSLTWSGRSPSTQYYYRIVATDSALATATSNQATSTTAAAGLAAGTITPGTPTATTVTNVSSAATGGTAPYTYQWYRSTSSGFVPGGGNIIVGATSLTLNDSGLTPATTYYYKVVVTDNVSATATSLEASLTTDTALAAGSITPGSVTSTTIAATCSAATDGTPPYTYQWYGSTSSGFVPGGGNIISGQTSLSLNWTGLSPSTTYYMKVVATDATTTATSAQASTSTSAASFAPTDITGLQYWFKADGLVYSDAGTTPATNGSTVQQWNDQSGNTRHLSQATGGNRPTFSTNIKNSLPAVLFDGSASYMDNATGATIAQPITIVTVMSLTANATVQTRNYFDHTVATTTRPVGYINSANQNFGHTAGTIVDSGVAQTVNNWYIVFHYFNGASSRFRINGTDTSTSNAGASGFTSGNGYRLGCRMNIAQFYPGYIAEHCVYNSAISGTDLTNLENYLNTKWAVF